jgi:hypothetical protein
MNSRVHPKYKTKYRVSNWAEYDRALVQRGDITLWISEDATDTWSPEPSGKRGGQRKFSDQAIETALVLWLVFKLPLRQAEGFLRSVLLPASGFGSCGVRHRELVGTAAGSEDDCRGAEGEHG